MRPAMVWLSLTTALIFSTASLADVAADSFAKTLANGQKKWAFKGATLNMKNLVGLPAKPNTTSAAKCSSTDLRLNGSYPKVSFRMSNFKCDKNLTPQELATLVSWTSLMTFDAFHIPAQGEPNQFRLSLNPTQPHPSGWEHVNSLNALIRDSVVFMDFLAEQREPSRLFGPIYHYLAVAIEKTQNGLEKLRLKATVSNHIYRQPSVHTQTEISLDADLERIN